MNGKIFTVNNETYQNLKSEILCKTNLQLLKILLEF